MKKAVIINYVICCFIGKIIDLSFLHLNTKSNMQQYLDTDKLIFIFLFGEDVQRAVDLMAGHVSAS